MHDLKIALGQIPVIPGNLRVNKAQILGFLERVAGKADVVVFPEMALTGYFLGDRWEDEDFIREVERYNQEIIARTAAFPDTVVIFGSVATDGKRGEDGTLRKYNAAFVAQNGKLITNRAGQPFAIKALLPNYRFFADSRHFFSARQYAEAKGVPIAAVLAPFDVELAGKNYSLGVMLCEDMWDEHYSLKVGEELKKAGADVLINLSASPWGWLKRTKRQKVARSLAKRTNLPLVYVNAVGAQSTAKHFLAFDGASALYNEKGEVAVELPLFAPATEEAVFGFGATAGMQQMSDQEQLLQALLTGMRAYVNTLPHLPDEGYRRMHTVVIGLSGGIDSAVSAALWSMVPGIRHVHGIAMPMEGISSDESLHLARRLADNLGIHFEVVPIGKIVQAIAETTGIRPWQEEYKSVQARARMEVLAARAHQLNGFFPSNANKTEIAFGYGTLTADLRGTFAPLADLVKREVYELAEHINTVLGEVIPQEIINRKPSDELEKGSIDPFIYGNARERGFHDELVRAVVQFRKSPEWFLRKYADGTLEQHMRLPEGHLRKHFPDVRHFVEHLDYMLQLLHNNFFKRVQLPPSVVVSRRAFGEDFREAHLDLVFSDEYGKLSEALRRG